MTYSSICTFNRFSPAPKPRESLDLNEADLFRSRSPMGYKGGDTNLYPYARNNPVNTIDPSGLAPPPQANPNPSVPSNLYAIGGGHDGTIQIIGSFSGIPGSKEAILTSARTAGDRVDKAYDLIKNYPDAVVEFAGSKLNLQRPTNRLSTKDGLKEWTQKLEKVHQALNSGSTTIDVDAAGSGEERKAYVLFIRNTNVSCAWAIHVTPLFFQTDDTERADVMLHELGRFYNNLGESITDSDHDVYVWDIITASLIHNYDSIRMSATADDLRRKLDEIEAQELIRTDRENGVTAGPTELDRVRLERQRGGPLNADDLRRLIEKAENRPQKF